MSCFYFLNAYEQEGGHNYLHFIVFFVMWHQNKETPDIKFLHYCETEKWKFMSMAKKKKICRLSPETPTGYLMEPSKQWWPGTTPCRMFEPRHMFSWFHKWTPNDNRIKTFVTSYFLYFLPCLFLVCAQTTSYSTLVLTQIRCLILWSTNFIISVE